LLSSVVSVFLEGMVAAGLSAAARSSADILSSSICVLRVEICHHSVGLSCVWVETGRDGFNLSKFTKSLLDVSKHDSLWYILDKNLHKHRTKLKKQGDHQCHHIGRTIMSTRQLDFKS
jgi:hypothetical protein